MTSPETTTQAESSANPIDPKQRLKGRLTLLGIILVFCTPLLFSMLWRPEGKVNFGELVDPPQPLPEVSFALPDGTAINTAEIRRKWIWATVVDGACDDACEQNLYTLRQTRLALGKNTKRVRYALIVLDPKAPAPKSGDGTEHPVLASYTVSGSDAEALRKQFSAMNALENQIVLIDPLGNVILRYASGVDGRKLKKDIGRVLKGSHVG